MIFRLLDFAFRVIGSFFFVFLLQFQFNGKTLESRLNNFGQKFFVTKALKKVSQDSSKVIKSFLEEESSEQKKQKREIANKKSQNRFKKIIERISRPSISEPESESKK